MAGARKRRAARWQESAPPSAFNSEQQLTSSTTSFIRVLFFFFLPKSRLSSSSSTAGARAATERDGLSTGFFRRLARPLTHHTHAALTGKLLQLVLHLCDLRHGGCLCGCA